MKIAQHFSGRVKTKSVRLPEPIFTAEVAEFFAKVAEENRPLRTSANASASSAFKKYLS